MNRDPHEPIWMLALAGATLASAVASCGGGGGDPGTGSAMFGARQSVTAQAAAGANGATMPANTMQPMAPQNPDAATLMQMGGAP